MTIAATCPGCGVMGGCICHVNPPHLPMPAIPVEPAVEGLPASPSKAFAEGYRMGFIDGFDAARNADIEERLRKADEVIAALGRCVAGDCAARAALEGD